MKRLDDIEARHQAASAAPWWTSQGTGLAHVYSGTGSGRDLAVADDLDPANADFVVHARKDVPDLAAFAREVQAANDRYMRGEVAGLGLSMDLHDALKRLNGEDPNAIDDPATWNLKPGDVIPGTLADTAADDWVDETARLMDAAPIGTFLRDREGDLWRHTHSTTAEAWTQHGRIENRPVPSAHLLSLYYPLTVVSVPRRMERK